MDYQKTFERSLRHINARKDITAINKKHINEFMEDYKNRRGQKKGKSVSPARKDIFLRHIIPFITQTTDIKKDMRDSKKIKSIFNKLETSLNESYYATCVDVSLRFSKWLNDSEKPEGFKDIDYLKTSKRMDHMRPEDLLTWEDGLEMCKQANSIQVQAVIMTLLDGGMRPSEFIDLKYSDIRKVKNSLCASVDGKTGKRDVLLWKSIPYLQAWLEQHPSKKGNDPLWIQENNTKQVQQYKYPALAKRIKEIGARAGINKPLDFYSFRHGSAKIMKKENMPIDLASSKLGHSVEFFTSVYGKESIEDRADRLDKHNGIVKKQDETETNIICSICGHVNKPLETLCNKCHNPLSLKDAIMEIEKAKETEGRLKLLEEMIFDPNKLNKLNQALSMIDK